MTIDADNRQSLSFKFKASWDMSLKKKIHTRIAYMNIVTRNPVFPIDYRITHKSIDKIER